MKIDPKIKAELQAYLETKIHDRQQRVTLVSPFALSQTDSAAVIQRFTPLTGVHVENQIDPSLLAGIVIKFGTKMIDLSLKTELLNLKQRIYESA